MHLVTNRVKNGDFSVLISVYGLSDPRHFDEALDSIWTKQVLKPSQICLVKDGVLTETLNQICDKWKKNLGDVLNIVELKSRSGLAVSLNTGLTYCKYPLVARMDADDVALPCRFLLQYNYMQSHPEIDVLGGQIDEYNDDLNVKLASRLVPLKHDEIVRYAKLRSPFNHPTVMYRKCALEQIGGYPLFYPEDYPLWGKMALNGFIFANLPQTLLLMRSSSAYEFRRGISFFCSEYKVVKYLHEIGFLSSKEFIQSMLLRFCYRICPYKVKIYIKSLLSKRKIIREN